MSNKANNPKADGVSLSARSIICTCRESTNNGRHSEECDRLVAAIQALIAQEVEKAREEELQALIEEADKHRPPLSAQHEFEEAYGYDVGLCHLAGYASKRLAHLTPNPKAEGEGK